jgi:hypothetical protein
MRITVYIPNRNMEKTLGDAVESACRGGADEVVVIDDASTDRSVDLVVGLMSEFQTLRCVTRRVRSRCWQEAAADHYGGFIGTHVIALGADDVLSTDIIKTIRETGDPAIVFSDYLVIHPGSQTCGLVSQGVRHATVLTAEQVQERYKSIANPTETGIGSAIRKDLLLWLKSKKFWEMGPWSDAIGYGAVAALHGAVYLDAIGAAIVESPAGYGATGRGGINAAAYKQASKDFIVESGLDKDAATALLRKRGVYA